MCRNELEDYYRVRAPEYEQVYYRDNPERRRELDDEAARLRQLVSGKSVLELACGTGFWTEVMSATAGSLTATDISREMLEQAQKKRYEIPVSFVRADMFGQSFGVNRYDVIALGFWFSHQPRQEHLRLFEILTAPLKESGLIWMIDNNPPAEGPRVQLVRTDEHGNCFRRRFLDNGEGYVIMKNYFSRSELETCLGDAFEIRSLEHKPYYWSVVLSRKDSQVRTGCPGSAEGSC